MPVRGRPSSQPLFEEGSLGGIDRQAQGAPVGKPRLPWPAELAQKLGSRRVVEVAAIKLAAYSFGLVKSCLCGMR